MARRKILIMHASAGHGHEKAARAVLEACGADSDTKLYDVLDLIPPIFGEGYRATYIYLIKHMPWLWGILYGASDLKAVYFFLKPFRRIYNSFVGRNVAKLILRENPDVLVATHFMPVEIASALKRQNKIKTFLISVITDYKPHSFWLEKEVDLYAVGMGDTREELEKRAVPAAKIHITGIPVDKKFAAVADREQLFTQLGLSPGVLTILLTTGGAGIGSVEDIVSGILAMGKPVQMLVVCGTNKTLLETLEKKSSESLKVYGFVNNMDELMRVSDLIVGKGGGLTIAESLSIGRPLIIFQPIPGQESRNAVSLSAHSAGISAKTLKDVLYHVRELIEKPEKRESLRQAIELVRRPLAAAQIARLAEHGSG